MRKLHAIVLTEEESRELGRLSAGEGTANRKQRAARALLLAAAGHTDLAIAYEVGFTPMTVWRLRKRAAAEGALAALERRRPRRTRPYLLNAEAEARLRELASGPPPAGHARWSLHLLAKHLVELGIVETICHETVRRALKRGRASTASQGATPPAKRELSR